MAIDPKFERCLEAYLTREHNLKWGGYDEAMGRLWGGYWEAITTAAAAP
jgi:hypothetical protein